MKAEVKFANTSNGPKAFVKTFDDDWTPVSTPLKAYKKDMRSIKPADNYEEGKDYTVAVSPWVLEAFLKANQIDYVQLIRGQDLKNPPVGSVRYANEKEVVCYEYSSATTTRRCTDLSRAKQLCSGMGQSRLPYAETLQHKSESAFRERLWRCGSAV